MAQLSKKEQRNNIDKRQERPLLILDEVKSPRFISGS